MQNRLFKYMLISIIAFYGCKLGKPRAEGADNELVVVTSFEDREDIRYVITALFNDTLYSPQPEPFYRVVWVDPENFNDIKFHVNVIVAGIGDDIKSVAKWSEKKMTEEDSPEELQDEGWSGVENIPVEKEEL